MERTHSGAPKDRGIWGTWLFYDLWTLTFAISGKEQEVL